MPTDERAYIPIYIYKLLSHSSTSQTLAYHRHLVICTCHYMFLTACVSFHCSRGGKQTGEIKGRKITRAQRTRDPPAWCSGADGSGTTARSVRAYSTPPPPQAVHAASARDVQTLYTFPTKQVKSTSTITTEKRRALDLFSKVMTHC